MVLPDRRTVVEVDKLTYSRNRESLAAPDSNPGTHISGTRHYDRPAIVGLLALHSLRSVLQSSADSHFDRSIHGLGEFVRTNIHGTFELLEAVRYYWGALSGGGAQCLVVAGR